ncbi:MAG TPA: hypothetical protein VL172_00045 [Kofleriaceae bacterium]|jgi:hypothetical protein|nr:hypothetical protein [Kofleriaceae bacterium]
MTTKKRKRRRGGGGAKKKGGVLMGMRSGFKNVAHTVAGKEEPKSRAGKIASTALTVVLVIAAAWMLYRRFG